LQQQQQQQQMGLAGSNKGSSWQSLSSAGQPGLRTSTASAAAAAAAVLLLLQVPVRQTGPH
jgi:hypothetical protein